MISIIRLFTLASAINTEDPTWDNVPTSWWSTLELNCGILCASLPTLRPLLRRATGGLSSSGGLAVVPGQVQPRGRGYANARVICSTRHGGGGQPGGPEGERSVLRDGAESIESSSQTGGSTTHGFTRDLYGPKNAHKITTAISGGSREQYMQGSTMSADSSPNGSLRHTKNDSRSGITVTTETRRDESRNGGKRTAREAGAEVVDQQIVQRGGTGASRNVLLDFSPVHVTSLTDARLATYIKRRKIHDNQLSTSSMSISCLQFKRNKHVKMRKEEAAEASAFGGLPKYILFNEPLHPTCRSMLLFADRM